MTNGVEIAKSIAIGANLAGIARPFLVAASQSTQAVVDKIEEISSELKITMFTTGVKDIASLAQIKLIIR